MKKKVCFITGTRAEYGLLSLLMQKIRADDRFQLQLAVTGMHLSPEFGCTYQTIEGDGFSIDRKVDLLLSSDSPTGICKSVGLGVIGFADAYANLNPDLVVVLGDRFEILSAVTAALFTKIPVLHIHGGEVTEGVLDESIRHAITKMSHVHCVATEEYRQRVIQLGEHPDRVHCVGGLGVDVIKHIQLMESTELEEALNFKFRKRNLLITFHPETLSSVPATDQMAELLAALGTLDNTGLIFTLPNADTGGRNLIAMLHSFVSEHANACVFSSLGQVRYLSCMKICNGVVGNSSSGLLEAPTLGIGTINIGNRQKGRVQATSIINCQPIRREIEQAINQLFSPTFQEVLINAQNPYGDGGAAERILEVIGCLEFDKLLQKPFHDLNLNVDNNIRDIL